MLTRNLMTLSAAILLSACVSNEPERAAAQSLLLREVSIPGIDSLHPASSRSFAVAPDGRVAFVGGYDPGKRLVTIIDTMGRLEQFGRQGQGPGEFSSPTGVFVEFSIDGDTLFVYDLLLARLTTRTRDGTMSSVDISEPTTGWPVSIASDSIDVMAMNFDDDARYEGVARIAVRSASKRTLLSLNDSAAAVLKGTSERRMPPIIATTRNRVVLGNRYTARFQSYDATGQPLHAWGHSAPERFLNDRELDSIVKERGPHGVTREIGGRAIRSPTAAQVRGMLNSTPQWRIGAMRFDPTGRLWVMGVGDSLTPFEVYSDTTLVGRVTLPCRPAGFEMKYGGDWLAIVCGAPESDAGMRIRLFEVNIPSG